MNRHPLTAPALFATTIAVALIAAGCSAQPAATVQPQTLTLFHIDGGPELDPAVTWFAQAVSDRSGGKITVEVTQRCCGDVPDVEENLVGAIADGKADLGWVGTRVFAELGVDSLEALTAPLLIDSYTLEAAALGSPEAATALEEVGDLGVTPLALVPGSLRYPLAAAAPIASVADWSGVTVASFHSARNAEAFRALGAEPVDVGFSQRDDEIADGTIGALENSLIMQDLGREQTLPYTTIDVALWPRTSALIADPASDAAKPGVAEILRRAAADVLGRTTDLGALDAAAMKTSCTDGARFALAGAAGISAMRAAVRPVIDAIAADAAAAPLLAAVQALAEDDVRPEPLIPTGCDGQAPTAPSIETTAPGDASALNGSYQTPLYTEEQLLAAGFPAQEARNAAAQFTLIFTDGRFSLIARQGSEKFHCTGTYTVHADQVQVDYFSGGDCGPGGVFFTATFAVDENALTLTDTKAPLATDAWLFGNAPLTRIG